MYGTSEKHLKEQTFISLCFNHKNLDLASTFKRKMKGYFKLAISRWREWKLTSTWAGMLLNYHLSSSGKLQEGAHRLGNKQPKPKQRNRVGQKLLKY